MGSWAVRRTSGFFVVTALALRMATLASAQEPQLALRKGAAGAIVVEMTPAAGLPDPALLHVYRGDLARVAAYEQVGDPDGRCSIPGDERSASLDGDLLEPGSFYYLLSAVGPAGETTLGFGSSRERDNNFPCPSVDCGSHGSGGVTGTARDLTMDVLGTPRRYHRHVPATYDPSVATPLLIFFHGLGGSADGALAFYQMPALADANDAIVLFPDSLDLPDCGPIEGGKHWDVCENPPDPTTSQDVVFTRQLIAETADLYNVCLDRIYTHGHSYGGFFSFYVATTLPDEIAAFAEHSGGVMVFAPGVCWPRCVPVGIRPIPGMLLHSTDDSVVDYSLSVLLDAELTAAGHESNLVTLTGLDHSFDRSRNQETWDWLMARPLR